mmetsp:Transcript_20109/g.30118  ORF Transcript_20109/g.30118 Transcript_20109/m.30118 type:complete len:95 (-) Transcript_20109:148-432(-)
MFTNLFAYANSRIPDLDITLDEMVNGMEWCQDSRTFILVHVMVMLFIIMAQHDRWQPLGLQIIEFQEEEHSEPNTPVTPPRAEITCFSVIAPAA